MLSTFPDLFAFMLVAPLILRLVLAFSFFDFGHRKIKNRAAAGTALTAIGVKNGPFWLMLIAVVEIAVGALFIAGAFTQIAAILSVVILFIGILSKGYREAVGLENRRHLAVLAAVALSLLFMGAGFWAVDLMV
jgi:uncharacterized membrane protein YphA (DoxX/SURF4 family)